MQLNGTWKFQYFTHLPPANDEERNKRFELVDGLTYGAQQPDFDDASWWSATVPGNVQSMLHEAGEAPDPLLGRNAERSRWVEDKEWWFRKRVRLPALKPGQRLRLRFAGVDTLATYWLNGVELGTSSDMFVPAVFDITDLVSAGENVLAVRISPPPASPPRTFKDGTIPPRARIHKMQCSWGWDWLRAMVPIGIWDDVSVEIVGPAWIEAPWVRAEPVAAGVSSADSPCVNANGRGTRPGEAIVRVEVRIAGAIPQGEGNELAVENPAKRGLCRELRRQPSRQSLQIAGEAEQSATAQLLCEIFDPAGRRVTTAALEISGDMASGAIRMKNPRLWWPNGYGPQPLYTACLTLRAGGRELDRRKVRFGIRSLRWERNEGAEPESHPLTVVVNDRRIFLRGSNWVPADALPGRLRPKHYRMLLDRAREMNLNLLRIWGGGLFEKEAFYDYCDEMGLLVWQEFPMACSNYPKDPEFVAEMVAEAEYVVRRLRNHPSICLWCGGNENDYYGEVPDSPTLLAIGEVVKRLHPGVDYHVSCPDKSRPGERGHGPWTFQEHAEWNKHFRQLASEVGCNALPSERTLDWIAPDEPWPAGPSFAYHFASTFRHLIWAPGEKYAGAMPFAPATRAEWVLFSQFIQAEQLAYMTGHYRSMAWRASGIFGWQFNTAWPEGCWSVVEWDGTPKMAWYWLRAAQAPVSCFCEDGGMDLTGKDCLELKPFVFDSTLKHPGRCESVLALWSAEQELWSDRREVLLDGPECVALDPVRIPLPEGFTGPLLLRHEIRKGRRLLIRVEKFFHRGNARECFDQLAVIRSGRRLRNGTGRVAFVAIPPGRGAPLAENFFFLLPGENRGQCLFGGD